MAAHLIRWNGKEDFIIAGMQTTLAGRRLREGSQAREIISSRKVISIQEPLPYPWCYDCRGCYVFQPWPPQMSHKRLGRGRRYEAECGRKPLSVGVVSVLERSA